jgi:hypothetical protein
VGKTSSLGSLSNPLVTHMEEEIGRGNWKENLLPEWVCFLRQTPGFSAFLLRLVPATFQRLSGSWTWIGCCIVVLPGSMLPPSWAKPHYGLLWLSNL